MRLLPFAVLALLLAGCSAADDDAPPNADPNGPPETQPPLPPSNTTGPPSDTSSSSSTATSTVAFGPHDEEETASDPDFSGLAVNGRLTGSGGALRIEAVANKVSPAQYKVPSGQCNQPWTESLVGPAGAVQQRQPVATCAAFGLRPMQDNEAIPVQLEWNGTLWDAGAGRYVAAPSGTYTWQATFHVYSGGEGAQYTDSADLTLSFEARVP